MKPINVYFVVAYCTLYVLTCLSTPKLFRNDFRGLVPLPGTWIYICPVAKKKTAVYIYSLIQCMFGSNKW